MSTYRSASPSGQEEEVSEEYDSYEDWDYRDLQAEAKERGLPATGSAEEIIERLVADDEGAEDVEPEEEEVSVPAADRPGALPKSQPEQPDHPWGDHKADLR